MLTCLLLLWIQSDVRAQDSPFYIGGYMEYNIAQLDDQDIKKAFKEPVDVSYENTFGMQIRGGMEFNEYMAGELMLEYVNPFQDDSDDKTAEVSVIDLGFNFKTILAFFGRVEPYAVAGLGIMSAETEITFMDQSRSEKDIGLNARIGLGVDVSITPKIYGGFEMAYVAGIGATDQVKYMNFSLGMTYRF
jgi:opacity protein-like surface antigen